MLGSSRPTRSHREDQGGLFRFASAPRTAMLLFSGWAYGSSSAAAVALEERYDAGVELWSAAS